MRGHRTALFGMWQAFRTGFLRTAKERHPHFFAFVCVLVGALLVLLCTRVVLFLLPYPHLASFMHRQNSSRFYDRTGELLYILPLEDGLRREYFPLSEIPVDLQKIIISEEDAHFYFHCGVDFFSVARAFWQNKKAGHVVSGASTITMQVVRLISPRTKKASFSVKVREMALAFWLEAKLSKKQILELYLNTVPFGYQTEGVASAARLFFDANLRDLTSEQMQTLSRIPRRPADYAPERAYNYQIRCPHFLRYVIQDYEKKGQLIPDKVTLSIDVVLLEKAEHFLQQKLDEAQEARVHNGSVLAIDNHTGEIIVWLGNAAFEDEAHAGQIDGILVKNQPGSAMKPFLYACALENGARVTDVLPDIPQDFGGEGVYIPLNFNNSFNGPVSFRVSLASSLNVPAVYMLYHLGIDSYMETLFSLGFSSLEGTREQTGLSLALGASEVTLYEMVRAFSVFANDGNILEHLHYTKKKVSFVERQKRVYSADTSRILCSILSDKAARELGFGHAAVFDTPYPCIFKTGTSNQFQNIIALGSTKDYTVGVWMGNFAGETVIKKTGSSIPAAVVRLILDELSAGIDGTSGAYTGFAEPNSYAKVKVCALSGCALGPACPAATTEYVKKKEREQFESEPCTWHYRENNRVLVRYPSLYQHWANNRNIAGSVLQAGPLEVQYPKQNARFVYDPALPPGVQELRIQASGGQEPHAELFVDGTPRGSAEDGLFMWHIPLERGTHTLSVVCAHEVQSVTFFVD